MIEVVPAILTDNIEDFKTFLDDYKIFDKVDIDFIRKPYLENETVYLSNVLKTLESFDNNFGFHLMVLDPEFEVHMLLNSEFQSKPARIYAQQEANLKTYLNLKFPDNWEKNISVEADSELLSLDFYLQFDEVQFMTVKIGSQGNPFQEEVLKKVDRLREMGYNGKVSIDGGVNLKTSGLIRKHKLDRVSVGSYFVKTVDDEKALKLLSDALNN